MQNFRKQLVQQLQHAPNTENSDLDEFRQLFEATILNYPLAIHLNDKGLTLTAKRAVGKDEVLLRECPLTLALQHEFKTNNCSTCSQPLTEEDKLQWSSRSTVILNQLTQSTVILCCDCQWNNYLMDTFLDEQQLSIRSCDLSIKTSDTALYLFYTRLFCKYSIGLHAQCDEDTICSDFAMSQLLQAEQGAIASDLQQDIEKIAKVVFNTNESKHISAADIEEMCRIATSNQHAISAGEEGSQDVGRAFYPIAALLNHSCDPNVKWLASASNSAIIQCRALRDIAEGEELCVSYLHPSRLDMNDVLSRQVLLRTERQFSCLCTLCNNEFRPLTLLTFSPSNFLPLIYNKMPTQGVSVIAGSTNVYESSHIASPVSRVWETVRPLNFKWLSTVKDCSVSDGKEAEVGSLRKITYNDDTVQTVKLLELSDLDHFVTWQVITSEPAVSVSSVVHTIRLRRITADDTTVVEWLSDYSSDATQSVIQDSKYKKLEGFQDLIKAVNSKKRVNEGGASPKKSKK